MIQDPPGTYGGMRVVVTDDLPRERVLHARSPSRAKRRAAMGHPQHYIERASRKAIIHHRTVYVTPEMWKELKAAPPSTRPGPADALPFEMLSFLTKQPIARAIWGAPFLHYPLFNSEMTP